MELLYQSTMNEKTANELMDEYFEDNHDDLREDTDMTYLADILNGVSSHKELIDGLIEKYLVNWKLPRVSKINLSILRLATYELLFVEGIPNNVSIYEAVEMAKKYSDETSGAFVNGVLDKISNVEDAEALKSEEMQNKAKLEAEAAEEDESLISMEDEVSEAEEDHGTL